MILYLDPRSHEIKLVIKKGVEAKTYDEQVMFLIKTLVDNIK